MAKGSIYKSYQKFAVLLLFTSSVVANAFGLNILQLVVHCGNHTFNLSTQNHSFKNSADRKTYSSIDEVFEDTSSKPLLPRWLPNDFTFKYAEKFTRSENTNILLYYEDSNNKAIVFDLIVYGDLHNSATDTDYEKDDNLVEVYKKKCEALHSKKP